MKFRTDKQSPLDKEILNLLKQMETKSRDSEEYSVMSENLERLYKAKSYEQVRRVSPDTLAVVAGNLLGIALILGYEQVGVISTKALGFVIKGRV